MKDLGRYDENQHSAFSVVFPCTLHTPRLKFGVLTECTLEVLPGGDIALRGLF